MKTEVFGKDHWSTFAYVETCCVENHGELENIRLRINNSRHPVGRGWDPKYGTRVKNGSIPDPDHDDLDCLDDLEDAGLIEQIGTMINPTIRLTERGFAIAGSLRRHKANGGQFATFEV